jgi:hypothetical protein
MSEEEKKHGRPWTRVATFDTFEKANERRLTEQESNGTEYDVKVRLRSEGFAVVKRIKEEFVNKNESKSKRKKKLSNKSKKQRNQKGKRVQSEQ